MGSGVSLVYDMYVLVGLVVEVVEFELCNRSRVFYIYAHACGVKRLRVSLVRVVLVDISLGSLIHRFTISLCLYAGERKTALLVILRV